MGWRWCWRCSVVSPWVRSPKWLLATQRWIVCPRRCIGQFFGVRRPPIPGEEKRMSLRVGINGFGRIGRLSLRRCSHVHRRSTWSLYGYHLVDVELDALLFKHDSTYGQFSGIVEHSDHGLVIDGRKIEVFRKEIPERLALGFGVEIVVELTGRFKRADQVRPHLENGAHTVIRQRPDQATDLTIVLGVNEGEYDPPCITSSATPACTTNCSARRARFCMTWSASNSALMNTFHSYTMISTHPRWRQSYRGGRIELAEHHPHDHGCRRALSPRHPRNEGQSKGSPRCHADRIHRRPSPR